MSDNLKVCAHCLAAIKFVKTILKILTIMI